MQCFQKDPNLRVSARKLLKHPWIVNAKRTDAVVPKKPTEYNEAIKSVQEWNEALKSPNAGSLRKAARPAASSPTPTRRDVQPPTSTPARSVNNLLKARIDTEQFRSPSNSMDDDRWDDDFDSAISPTALKLPHLRPHDNFGGLLSAEKLKAFASFETVAEEGSWGDMAEGESTVKSPALATNPDPLRTIRPTPSKSDLKKQRKTSTPRSDSKRPVSASSKTSAPVLRSKRSSNVVKALLPSTTSFAETEDEDYSDLIVDDASFDVKLRVKKVLLFRKLISHSAFHFH